MSRTEQTMDEHVDREVKPHLPDTWIDDKKTKTGCEFNPLRSLAEIRADLPALEESSLEIEKTVLED